MIIDNQYIKEADVTNMFWHNGIATLIMPYNNKVRVKCTYDEYIEHIKNVEKASRKEKSNALRDSKKHRKGGLIKDSDLSKDELEYAEKVRQSFARDILVDIV